MKEKLKAIKEHVKAHKGAYITAAGVAAVAIIGTLAYKNGQLSDKIEQLEDDNDILRTVTILQESEIIDLDLTLDNLRESYSWVNGGRGL